MAVDKVRRASDYLRATIGNDLLICKHDANFPRCRRCGTLAGGEKSRVSDVRKLRVRNDMRLIGQQAVRYCASF